MGWWLQVILCYQDCWLTQLPQVALDCALPQATADYEGQRILAAAFSTRRDAKSDC